MGKRDRGRWGGGRTWHSRIGREDIGRSGEEGREGREERVCVIALCVGMDMSGYINILQIPKAHVYTHVHAIYN